MSEQGRDRFRAGTIGYVFQTFNLLPAFTALENVRLGMTFGHGRHEASRAVELLARVGLSDRANYRPGQLSVGQQQRVAIARALAGKPKILLADEPTANVDPVSAETVLDLIRQTCREEDVALLMVTHDMRIAETFDRIEKLDEINRVFASMATILIGQLAASQPLCPQHLCPQNPFPASSPADHGHNRNVPDSNRVAKLLSSFALQHPDHPLTGPRCRSGRAGVVDLRRDHRGIHPQRLGGLQPGGRTEGKSTATDLE